MDQCASIQVIFTLQHKFNIIYFSYGQQYQNKLLIHPTNKYYLHSQGLIYCSCFLTAIVVWNLLNAHQRAKL